MDLPEQSLVNRIDLFLEATGMSPSGFGIATVGDSKLVPELKAGRNLRRDTRDRIIGYMSQVKAQIVSAVDGEAA